MIHLLDPCNKPFFHIKYMADSKFLTPDLKPAFGGTFFWQAQFVPILNRLHEVWTTKPEEMLKTSRKIVQHLQQKPEVKPGSALDKSLLTEAVKQFNDKFDSVNNSFDMAHKDKNFT